LNAYQDGWREEMLRSSDKEQVTVDVRGRRGTGQCGDRRERHGQRHVTSDHAADCVAARRRSDNRMTLSQLSRRCDGCDQSSAAVDSIGAAGSAGAGSPPFDSEFQGDEKGLPIARQAFADLERRPSTAA
jgi:hypothetical protein